MEKIKCDICGKEFSKKGIGSHVWRMHTEDGKNHKCGCKTSWNKGLTEKDDDRVKKNSDKIRKYYQKHDASFKGKKHTKETKRKMSQTIKKRYEDGWMPKAGRCKKIWYESDIAGKVSLDGTWELKVAIYLDLNNIEWKRNTERFPYFGEDEKIHYYTPDFYLPESDSYLEVKGYETDLDRLKWSQFPKELDVWKKRELKERKII